MFEVLNLSKKSEDIQRMAEMLKRGATLTELSCPACVSPLFRFKGGELWCAKCKKRVVVVKDGQSAEAVASEAQLATLRNTLLTKMQSIEKRIQEEEDAEELQKLSEVLATLLENLEKLKRAK